MSGPNGQEVRRALEVVRRVKESPGLSRQDQADVLRAAYTLQAHLDSPARYPVPMPIERLLNDGTRVLLLRHIGNPEFGNDSVRCALGYKDAAGEIRGWTWAHKPTHFVEAPEFVKPPKKEKPHE